MAGRAPAWLEWESERAATVRTLTLDPVDGVRRPTLVRLKADGEARPPLEVGPAAPSTCPQPLRGRRFRLEILRAAFPPGHAGRGASAARGRHRRGARDGVPKVKVPRSDTLGIDCSRSP